MKPEKVMGLDVAQHATASGNLSAENRLWLITFESLSINIHESPLGFNLDVNQFIQIIQVLQLQGDGLLVSFSPSAETARQTGRDTSEAHHQAL